MSSGTLVERSGVNMREDAMVLPSSSSAQSVIEVKKPEMDCRKKNILQEITVADVNGKRKPKKGNWLKNIGWKKINGEKQVQAKDVTVKTIGGTQDERNGVPSFHVGGIVAAVTLKDGKRQRDKDNEKVNHNNENDKNKGKKRSFLKKLTLNRKKSYKDAEKEITGRTMSKRECKEIERYDGCDGTISSMMCGNTKDVEPSRTVGLEVDNLIPSTSHNKKTKKTSWLKKLKFRRKRTSGQDEKKVTLRMASESKVMENDAENVPSVSGQGEKKAPTRKVGPSRKLKLVMDTLISTPGNEESNFLRVLIFKVMQQSQKHLDKILNIDEFVRRIYSVIHSNDPVARALTLRTLGSIASVVAEKKNIHHSIRNSLDSHDAVELEAAIFAAGRFAAQSKIFASNICPKIGEMIQSIATPVDIKLKLLTVFQQMHHDAQTTSTVRNLCMELLPSYPSWQFTVATLHTLTQLAANSITDISEQVELLIQHLQNDPRQNVKLHAFQDLEQLAKKGSHLWMPKYFERVVEFALNTPYLGLKIKAMDVLVILASSYAVDKFEIYAGCRVLQLCEECLYHSNEALAAVSIELLTCLTIYVLQEDIALEGINLLQEVSSAIETLLLVISTEKTETQSHTKALQRCLRCTVRLCEVNPDLCTQFVDTLGTLIGHCTDECIIPICETLCALGNKRAGVMASLQPELVAIIVEHTNSSNLNTKKTQALVMMCTLLFQASGDCSFPGQESQLIMKIVDKLDLWSSYRIARQATRYGHHEVASQIFSFLCNRVNSEHLHFWLMSLWEISEAENCLQKCRNSVAFHNSLSLSITHYAKAVSAVKAATSPVHSLQFQCEYIRLRSEMLQAHLQLQHACSCIKTSPPPAIAASVALVTRDELRKSGRVVTQLRKCAKEFHALAEQYGGLYQSVFDADPKTLSNIQLWQQSCLLSAQAIERLVQHNHGMGFSSGLIDEDILNIECAQQTLENQKILDSCRRASVLIRDVGLQGEVRVIGRKDIDNLLRVSHELTLVPLCLPRFFFQTLQSTSIKLAISPQPKMAGDPIYIQNTSHLAIKVEGVVQHGAQPGLFRKVSKVTLVVSSVLQARAASVQDTKVSQETSNSMTQTATPHNDYFQLQFLLAFTVPGLHIVTVEAMVADEKEAQWKTGPRMMLSVKSHDDNQKPSRSTFGSRF